MIFPLTVFRICTYNIQGLVYHKAKAKVYKIFKAVLNSKTFFYIAIYQSSAVKAAFVLFLFVFWLFSFTFMW